MKRRDFIETSSLALMGLIATGCNLSTFKDKKPNILLVMTDQQSAEAMSFLKGTKYFNTPVMDKLAKEGMNFNNAYCANPLCKPSRTSMFTGRYPHETGLQTNDNKKFLSTDDFPSMGKIFKDNGYDTGYVGKWHIAYKEDEKEAHGFDYMENIMNNGADIANPEKAIDFIKEKRDNPFFLVASFNNPHNICEWSRGQDLADGVIPSPPPIEECPPLRENMLPPENETDIMTHMRKSYQKHRLFPVSDFDDKKWREYVWAYYRMLEIVDKKIGLILDALRETGQEENTVIVLTSDHGDCQGAHKWNQKTVFYDESSRIPLIINYKGNTKIGTSDRLINTGVDMFPTLFDYAGIKIPEYLPGTSLKKTATGKINTDPREYIVISNEMAQGEPVDGIKHQPEGRMLRSKQYKYCAYSIGERRESLVDMINDPGEMVNLAGKEKYDEVLKQHRTYLSEWCVLNNDPFEIPN